jgi:hypothetical protein
MNPQLPILDRESLIEELTDVYERTITADDDLEGARLAIGVLITILHTPGLVKKFVGGPLRSFAERQHKKELKTEAKIKTKVAV